MKTTTLLRTLMISTLILGLTPTASSPLPLLKQRLPNGHATRHRNERDVDQ